MTSKTSKTPPIPAFMAYPSGEEPMTDEALRALDVVLERTTFGTVEETMAAVLRVTDEPEIGAEGDRVRDALALGVDLANRGDSLHDDWNDEAPPVALLERAARFRVEDDGAAEWAARKLAATVREQEEATELAAQWKHEIDVWLRSRTAPLTRRAAFFEGSLLDYLRRRMEDDPKLRTIKLPSAELKGTVSKPKVGLVENDEGTAALIAWADENLGETDLAAVVKTTRKPMVSELRKVATVSEEEIGTRLVVELECGHGYELFRPAGAIEPEAPEVGVDHEFCAGCSDPIEGEPARLVMAVTPHRVVEPVVRDNDTGQIVPGAVVTPETTTLKVSL